MATLVHVLSASSREITTPVELFPDDLDGDPADSALGPEDLIIDAAQAFDAAMLAAEIAGRLTPTERWILLHLDDVAALQERFHCGRSTAYLHIKRVRETVLPLAGTGDFARQVLLEVIQLCEADWTPGSR